MQTLDLKIVAKKKATRTLHLAANCHQGKSDTVKTNNNGTIRKRSKYPTDQEPNFYYKKSFLSGKIAGEKRTKPKQHGI